MKTLFITCAVVLSIPFAQEHDMMDDMMDQDEMGHDDGERRQRMESMMIWRLTEELDLKTEQAEKFFPRFREHRKILDEIRDQEREIGKTLRGKLKDESLNKSEVTAAVKKITSLRKKQADVEEKFILGMDDLLDVVQMTKLGMFKQKMMREMGGEMRKRGNEKKKMKKMKKMNRQRGGHRKRGFWN